MEPAEILDALERLRATATVEEGTVRLKYPRSASAKIQALGPEIKRSKPEILPLLKISLLKPPKDRVLDGHRVVRVIWETDKAVIFQDEAGAFWRHLHAYRQAWPVIVGGVEGGNRGMEGRG